jgi:hypothetical protein
MAEDSAMKRIGIMLLQLLVTAAGIWYVFHDPQKRAQIADALREADRNWVILDAVNSWQLRRMASCENRLCARRFSGSFVSSWQQIAGLVVSVFFCSSPFAPVCSSTSC